MIRNYLRIAWRTLRHHRRFTLVNTVGLTAALTIALYFLLYHQHSTSFDRFHEKHDRIYRIVEEGVHPQLGRLTSASTPSALPQLLRTEIPTVEDIASITLFGQSVMTVVDDQGETQASYNERNYLITDQSFFQVFSYPHLAGNEVTSLSQPKQVVLTERAAKKYFGSIDVLGKEITNNRTGPLEIVGIVTNPPTNSHLDFDFLISTSTFLQDERGQLFFSDWQRSNVCSYVLTKAKLSKMATDNFFANLDIPSPNADQQRSFSLQPLSAIHFDSPDFENETPAANASKQNPVYLRIFRWITLLMLLIACINYINLASAKSLARSKEIGIRKVIGASRQQLFFQFISEGIITVAIAGILALCAAFFLRNYFSELLAVPFPWRTILSSKMVLQLLALVIVVGMLAGSLPAIILSGIKPIESLKGKLGQKMSEVQLRRGLTVFQFALAIVIVSATTFAYLQLSYLLNKDLGFDKEHLLTIDINSGTARQGFQTFKDAFGQHPSVRQVSATSRVPGEWKQIPQVSVKKGQAAIDSSLMYFFAFDEDAVETFDFRLLEGLNFSGDPALDSSTLLINKTAAKLLRLDNPVGRTVFLDNIQYPFQIKGIIEDFHVHSLHEELSPVVVGGWKNPIHGIDYFTCRTSGEDVQGLLTHLREVQTRLDPNTPLEYHFLDEQLDRFYKQEKKMANVLVLVSVLTLTIACLGLFGLITYMLSKRLKEVAVRKILGATGTQLWILLTKDVVLMLILGLLVGIPICWYLVDRWLENFAFSISINPLIFILVGTIMLVLALLTMHGQLLKTLQTDPVNSLRE